MDSKGIREKLKWLDPFTYVDLYVMPIINPGKNKVIETVVDIFFAFLFAFILYNFIFVFILGTSAPLVIVYSGSMEPVLYRGDVVVLKGTNQIDVAEVNVDFPVGNRLVSEYAEFGYAQTEKGLRQAAIKINNKEYLFDSSGPIVVYNSALRHQDIIHRAVLKLNAPDGAFLITFGDNNPVIDEDCRQTPSGYNCISLYPVPVKSLIGEYVFHIPFIGHLKLILLDDLPKLIFG